MTTFFKGLWIVVLFIVLTVLTQIGGVLYLLHRGLAWRLKLSHFYKRLALFSGLYLAVCLFLIPLIAPQFGRVHLPVFDGSKMALQPANLLLCLANRHYVRPELKTISTKVAEQMAEQYPGLQLVYLDANFPFWNGFPLLPHRSHDDGEKLDLTFVYRYSNGDFLSKGPSFLGYGYCEAAKPEESNQVDICTKRGYWQYGLTERLAFGKKRNLSIDEKATIALIKAFAQEKGIGKIFIEPHLKQRWGLQNNSKIRFHGCPAVRHDDHIHLQL
ncbi:MAG: hypothetical protein AAFP19_13000 [Bacteroidota bacterium]